jgi:hypothetical protein
MAKRKDETWEEYQQRVNNDAKGLAKGALKIGKSLVKRVGDNLKPNLLGVSLPSPSSSKPKPKPTPKVTGRPGERDTYAADKEAADNKRAAEVKPAKTPVRGSEQSTTTTRQPGPKRGTRNDAYQAARSKLTSSSTQEDRNKVRDMGMQTWAEANKNKNDAVGKKAREYLDKLKISKTEGSDSPAKPATKAAGAAQERISEASASTKPNSKVKPQEFDEKKLKKKRTLPAMGGSSYA